MDKRPNPVALLRCAYLDLFVSTFRTLGQDVTSDLSEARLPLEWPKCRGEYAPALPAFAFVTAAAQRHGIEDFGFLAGARLRLTDFDVGVRGELDKAETLGDALNSYCALVGREQSYLLCHLSEHAGGEVRICATAAALEPGHALNQYSEWLLIMSLVAIVRHATTSDWHPSQIAFQSQPGLGESVWRAFPETRFAVAQGQTWITVPAETLSLPWPARKDTAEPQQVPAKPASYLWDFPTSLSLALRPYLADGYPSIELAAKLVGMSVRTLQRRLNQCHQSYSDVVKQLRFGIAAELLRNPDKTVLDTACEVGFSDPSHFSRAFRQMAGVSPREFRKQQLAA